MLDVLTRSRSSRHAAWPARLALAAACVFCVWKAIALLWLALAGPSWVEVVPPPALPPVSAPVASGTVAQWHLFGREADSSAAQAQAQARATPLRLTLRGTLNTHLAQGGIAIIADEQGVERSYRVGDALPGQAQLIEIHAGQVRLLRDGMHETLALRPEQAAAAGAGAAGAAAPLPGQAASATSGVMPGGAVMPMIAPTAPDLQTYRAAQLPDVQALARQVQVMPVLDNGRMRGVRLAVGRDSDLLGRVGLRPNDIITSVNGIPLDKPERQAELIRNLQGARQVQVELERDGQPMKIQVAL